MRLPGTSARLRPEMYPPQAETLAPTLADIFAVLPVMAVWPRLSSQVS